MRVFSLSSGMAAAVLGLVSVGACAQNSDFQMEMHAKGEAPAAKIGLPCYPGAKLDKSSSSDSAAVDLGLSFGTFRFSVIAAGYTTADTPDKVFAYYRKPLSRYGDVLECVHGQPVGALKITSTGLTCSSEKGGHLQVNDSVDSANDHELRAGTPHRFHIVAIDSKTRPGDTHFGLVALELPRDSDNDRQSN
ncbi:hypothetical protein [Silvibacterium dinghuense]|uniref:Lipoprotein n=1 Tax=Silvibacterium dinghuense TaxID=1560006 RepID=A0A4V1NV29_9BACT|nr:hypothetical protein [Silvibacterium dinghuense]RXS94322.1 hypothetical protein ESZ00_14615 [Silvibacterium dinghuense]GGH16907.1 hypothetical protein GCM10011586_39080 [Silvibacterium dinghuense]